MNDTQRVKIKTKPIGNTYKKKYNDILAVNKEWNGALQQKGASKDMESRSGSLQSSDRYHGINLFTEPVQSELCIISQH